MPRIVPEPRPGERIVGEIERNEGAYWLVGGSAAAVPFVFNLAAMVKLEGLFWGLLIPIWVLSVAFLLSKRTTYYLTNFRLVEVSPFHERSLDLEDMDVVHLRTHVIWARWLPNPFGSTLTFRKATKRFRGRIRIPYVRNPENVINAIDLAVCERRVFLHNQLMRPRAHRTAKKHAARPAPRGAPAGAP